MTDVDRYITEAAIDALVRAGADTEVGAENGLRVALPGILARHRADVLREVESTYLALTTLAEEIGEAVDRMDAGIETAVERYETTTKALADEAVTS